MADLNSCYFCGDVEEITEYAVVPPRLDPTDEEQQSVVLCSTCHQKLTTTIKPIVNRIERLESQLDSSAGGRTTTTAGPGRDVEKSDDESQIDSDQRARDQRDRDADDPADTTDTPTGRVPREDARLAPTGEDLPEGYRTVLRFLENREFPVDRAAAEQLAANAYDLDEGTVESIVDAAIERGALRADGDSLHHPDR